ncbi:hypothetical protein [Streptomyces tubercidicus]|uniref:hypothetical protein n=1 Tax=Streptomyces tubercidicus TaxID=47759 RepID=UPI003466DC2E
MADNTPAQHADTAAEAVRAVNHLTQQRQAGWEYPGDAYSTVASLYEMTARLPQAIGQTHRFMRDLEDTGRLRSDHDTLDRDLAYTYEALKEARDLAERLGAALSRAHQGLGPISYQE